MTTLNRMFDAWKSQVDKDYAGVIDKQFRHPMRPYWGKEYNLLADLPEKFHKGNQEYREARANYEEHYGKVDWAAHKRKYASQIAGAEEYKSPPGWSWNGKDRS